MSVGDIIMTIIATVLLAPVAIAVALALVTMLALCLTTIAEEICVPIDRWRHRRSGHEVKWRGDWGHARHWCCSCGKKWELYSGGYM